MQWRHLGEKQQDAIRAQHVNIEFPSMCIDKSSNKEVSERSEKGFSLTLSGPPFATYYSQGAAITQTHISH